VIVTFSIRAMRLINITCTGFNTCVDRFLGYEEHNVKRRVLAIPRGWKLSSLLVQVLTRVLFKSSIPQVAAMKQK
jgi:hypothetical protein